ncbi:MULTISPECIES: hypothetical protein [unclassified Serratia (in: enterobacteria)]|uniref:hypothetical protein n=1 Tax=unclassified Serratia (in: enterobacteria) TaxID=2647522 RepID=UPI00068A78CA|nr:MULTISPECIES: hypothetical protein [unclassified Serratia (in: enterobacteria)]
MTDLKKLIAQAQGKSANEFWLATGRRPTDVIVELAQRLEKLAAENAELKTTIESIIDLDNQPWYDTEAMGCGLEDRGITDLYDAMRHGWDEAFERIYSEVIPEVMPETTATDAALAEVEARGVERFAKEYLRETAKEHSADGNERMALRFITFANMAEGFAAHLRNPPYRAKELREGRV